jgi:hypothetical protein
MHTLVRSNSAALKCYEGAVIYSRINIHVSEDASSADQKLILLMRTNKWIRRKKANKK